jgi:hypothetical protein
MYITKEGIQIVNVLLHKLFISVSKYRQLKTKKVIQICIQYTYTWQSVATPLARFPSYVPLHTSVTSCYSPPSSVTLFTLHY